MTAGSQLAGAVPEVASSSTGRWLALAMPEPKNAALRSSMATVQRNRGWRSMARASGVERDPGEMTASRDAGRDETGDHGLRPEKVERAGIVHRRDSA
jgi:hypothetical protein